MLALDPDNADARAYLEARQRRLATLDTTQPVARRLWTRAEEEELRQLAGRYRPTDIARRMNRSVSAIAKQAGKLGISLKYQGPPRRSRNAQSTAPDRPRG